MRALLPTALDIHMGRSRAVRSSLGIHYPCSFVPRDLLPALPPRSGRRVLFHLCGGSADSFVGGDVVATALRAPLRPRLCPTLPHRPPYPRPALIVAAKLDLPIRALLLRVVASPVCSAPGLRMRSPCRRPVTVCVSVPIRIPLRLPKHRLRKQDSVVERDHLLPVPRLRPRTGRSGCGCSCAARATTCSCVARRPWPTAGEDPDAGVGAETCVLRQWGTAGRANGVCVLAL
jgi:hypothetical protein